MPIKNVCSHSFYKAKHTQRQEHIVATNVGVSPIYVFVCYYKGSGTIVLGASVPIVSILLHWIRYYYMCFLFANYFAVLS